jgi:hypothetical protein
METDWRCYADYFQRQVQLILLEDDDLDSCSSFGDSNPRPNVQLFHKFDNMDVEIDFQYC